MNPLWRVRVSDQNLSVSNTRAIFSIVQGLVSVVSTLMDYSYAESQNEIGVTLNILCKNVMGRKHNFHDFLSVGCGVTSDTGINRIGIARV